MKKNMLDSGCSRLKGYTLRILLVGLGVGGCVSTQVPDPVPVRKTQFVLQSLATPLEMYGFNNAALNGSPIEDGVVLNIRVGDYDTTCKIQNRGCVFLAPKNAPGFDVWLSGQDYSTHSAMFITLVKVH